MQVGVVGGEAAGVRGDQVAEGLIALAEIMEYHCNSSGKPLKNSMQENDY